MQDRDYSFSITADEASHEYEVLLRGPGIDSAGRRFVFANKDRCAAFAEAVNFAYRQGLRDGRRRALDEADEPLMMVSGSTPESLLVRSETWLQRLRRVWFR